MSAQTLLSSGDKFFAYSGEVFGDVSAPATIRMILIPNTGLRDSLVYVQPFYGIVASGTTGTQLGIEIKLDDTTIYKAQSGRSTDFNQVDNNIQLFIPRQSKIEVISLNTSGNNTQIRGANLMGYYL
tara:strand:- start:366 stop:746 length:381 start_codon:yes stop_codon:yes gene_type:complete